MDLESPVLNEQLSSEIDIIWSLNAANKEEQTLWIEKNEDCDVKNYSLLFLQSLTPISNCSGFMWVRGKLNVRDM